MGDKVVNITMNIIWAPKHFKTPFFKKRKETKKGRPNVRETMEIDMKDHNQS